MLILTQVAIHHATRRAFGARFLLCYFNSLVVFHFCPIKCFMISFMATTALNLDPCGDPIDLASLSITVVPASSATVVKFYNPS